MIKTLTMLLHTDRKDCDCTNPEFELAFKPADGGATEIYTVHVADDNVVIVGPPTVSTDARPGTVMN